MRYELADYEWAAIKPMLRNKPRGVPRVNDRRVLNRIFWVLRSGAPWRDLPVGIPVRHGQSLNATAVQCRMQFHFGQTHIY
jgi:transposase